jgi:hypothetical protein
MDKTHICTRICYVMHFSKLIYEFPIKEDIQISTMQFKYAEIIHSCLPILYEKMKAGNLHSVCHNEVSMLRK